jgi:hypothetical protein
MSLVGRRPLPAYHNARFDPEFRQVRVQVRPGLTGLWQVSARSDGDLAVQHSLDNYYIRNWSPWLDIYILFRTVRAVLPRGSYRWATTGADALSHEDGNRQLKTENPENNQRGFHLSLFRRTITYRPKSPIPEGLFQKNSLLPASLLHHKREIATKVLTHF